MGSEARKFLDWLASAGARWWQVLPLGPTSYGDSPYQSFSAFAGNPYLIDIEEPIRFGWLEAETPPAFPAETVDYGWIYQQRWPQLKRAFAGFLQKSNRGDKKAFERFRRREAGWLQDYALFMSLKEKFGGKPWNEWPTELRDREPGAMGRAREELSNDTLFHSFTQWMFYNAWADLRSYAKSKGIGIIGDMPIFVAYDSADVWANPGYFYLDAQGLPTVVAGVPPDYFSETGQRWGNPLYRWEAIEQDGFSWWISRIQKARETCDLVRIDHFRGFEAYWEIPAKNPTAVEGAWIKAPGQNLFEAVRRALGEAPIIAEDLGVITPEVEALRDGYGFPGMKILQFAFSDEANPFLPHNYPQHGNLIVYTGTHDNDTTLSWYRTAPEAEKQFMREYLERWGISCHGESCAPEALMELAFKSPARLAVVPLQDVLGLGTEARMNFPGKLGGNWAWRYPPDALTAGLASRLQRLATSTGRI